jgi:hypothetical protein
VNTFRALKQQTPTLDGQNLSESEEFKGPDFTASGPSWDFETDLKEKHVSVEVGI